MTPALQIFLNIYAKGSVTNVHRHTYVKLYDIINRDKWEINQLIKNIPNDYIQCTYLERDISLFKIHLFIC